eukprot:TRINITY_DN15740_c0_g1_i14.p1 TRINITY_DN15740_c0_g1~~TRINITY_DN15740_c0_g1_i14.p1  ORF type:complete len:271 (+),score=7.56 TRINITY_DN15740_c0_g1_i14:53-865(+)
MAEKYIVMITGATDGIGLHTSKKIVREVDVLILHGRNPERLKNAETQVRSVLANRKESDAKTEIHCVLGDLGIISDVRNVARQVEVLVPHISCLINNAGVYLPQFHKTKDGLEQTFAVNVVAPYLLTKLFHHLIIKSQKPRVINTSSISQSWDVPPEYQLNERNYSGHTAYSHSKLFDRMITVGQAERIENVLFLTLDPGTVNTKMLLEGWGACGISIEDADDTYWLATNQDLSLTDSGNYYVHRRLSTGHNFTKDDIRKLFTYLDTIVS